MISRLVSCVSLAVLLVCVGSDAQAWAIRYSTSALESLSTSDTVTVDLYLDADPGLQLLSIGVLWEETRLAFQPLASTSASYILYTPTPGPGQSGQVDRVRDPWSEWPGVKPPGFRQLNVDYWVPFHATLGFPPAAASGTDIWLTSLVFHVISGAGGPPVIDVTLGTSSNILQANDTVVDPDTVPITLIPEPVTGLLFALGLAGAVAGGARRRSRRAGARPTRSAG